MAIQRKYFAISPLRPIFGAPALAMTLKLTLDTNTMRQIIVKRDAGQRCEDMKVGHLSDNLFASPKLHISFASSVRSSFHIHVLLYRPDTSFFSFTQPTL